MSAVDQVAALLAAARPRAMAALLRRFRDLDMAEEALQEACLRALKTWPVNGPPRDAEAWLIFVGRNAGIDVTRRRAKLTVLPDEDELSDTGDAEARLVESLDDGDYRDDLLRLMFVCCHPALPVSQQIALALRVVSGLSVREIARAFLVGEDAMEQRITRAKKRVAQTRTPFEAPGPAERAERLAAVMAMISLLFSEGYAASGGRAHLREQLCEEAIRLARLLLRMYSNEPGVMGLVALLLLQHSRAQARLDTDGAIVLLEDQDRGLWNRAMIGEGLALLDKAMRHARPDPWQIQAAIAALHARAGRFEDTDFAKIDLLYARLETMTPSPVVTLNRAVAVSKARGPAEALAMIEPLAERLSGYFYYHGARGAFLKQLGRAAEARAAFDQAISRASTPQEAMHIRMQIDRMGAGSPTVAEAAADGK